MCVTFGRLYQTNYTDGDGPRGAFNATDCCAKCAAQAGCQFWSFNIDPGLPSTPGMCVWAALTYCCLFHTSGANLTKLDPATGSVQFGMKGNWQSGSLAPASSSLSSASSGGGGATGNPVLSELVLHSSARVVAVSPALASLASVVSDDIFDVSGVRFANATGPVASVGDITFTLTTAPVSATSSPTTGTAIDESYSLKVSDGGVDIQCAR